MQCQSRANANLPELATAEMIATSDRFKRWLHDEIGRMSRPQKIALTILALPFVLADFGRDSWHRHGL